MSRKRKLLIVVLIVASVGLAGVLGVRGIPGSLAVGRPVVGAWEVGSWGEPEGAVEGAPAEFAGELSDQFGRLSRAAEETHLGRNGEVQLRAKVLGVEITTEGSWTAHRAEGGQLVVTAQMRKM